MFGPEPVTRPERLASEYSCNVAASVRVSRLELQAGHGRPSVCRTRPHAGHVIINEPSTRSARHLTRPKPSDHHPAHPVGH